MRGVSWVNLFLGLWLAASPFVLHLSGVLLVSTVASGILTALVAIWGVMAPAENHLPAWVGLVIAMWIMIAPWALHAVPADAPVQLGNNGLCGSIIAIFAIARSASADTVPHTAY
jgi:hypothetical protein